MPFVVFELAPGQPLPQFSDWIPVTAAPELAAPEAIAVGWSDSQNLAELQPPLAAEAVNPLTPAAIAALASNSVTTNPAAVDSVTGNSAAGNSVNHAASQSHTVSFASSSISVLPKRAPMASSSRRTWMPMALLFLSMLGGLLGVGLGFSWRFSSVQATGKADGGKSSPASSNLTPSLFGREQSFPSSSDWPVSEMPQIFTPAPTPIAAPDDSSSETYLPPERPLPEVTLPAPAPLPVQSSPQPTVATPTPSISPSPALAPIVPLAPAIGNGPSPAPIEITPPVEAAPDPQRPQPSVAPEPPPHPAPMLELPPPRRPKVFKN